MSKINSGLIPMDFIKEQLKDVYSTTETKTNKVWEDGKPIDRKVIKGTSGTGGSWQLIPTNISNLDKMTNIDFMVGSENENYPSSFYVSSAYQIAVRYDKESNGVRLLTGSGYSNLPYHFILEYTKTTD